jgi:hypothetical protein
MGNTKINSTSPRTLKNSCYLLLIADPFFGSSKRWDQTASIMHSMFLKEAGQG